MPLRKADKIFYMANFNIGNYSIALLRLNYLNYHEFLRKRR